MKIIYKAGIDIGSTTAKMVVYDNKNNMIFKTYTRHNADVKETLLSILRDLKTNHGDLEILVPVIDTNISKSP